jgi:methyl-accepting chemotaxis protein
MYYCVVIKLKIETTVRGIDRAPSKALQTLVEQIQKQLNDKNAALDWQANQSQWLSFSATFIADFVSIFTQL